MSRLLEALRHLQQPASATPAARGKVTPRLAASIRRAVLGNEAFPVSHEPEVLFRVPAATAVAIEDQPPSKGAGNPMALVEAIAASLEEVSNDPAAAIQSDTAVAPDSAPQDLPAPTAGETELRTLLADRGAAAPYRELLSAVKAETESVAAPIVLLAGLQPQDRAALVAALLATMLADEDRRVLLIEGNPISPDLAARFGQSNAEGLCESLAGRSGEKSLIRPTSHARLDLLPFGQATAEQWELLPPSLPAELRRLRRDYGAIVLDAGSLDNPWAVAASQSADAAYVLVRLQETAAQSAVARVKAFRAAGGRLTGCVAMTATACG